MSTICVIGDSITLGVGDSEGGGWVSLLDEYIRSKGQKEIVLNLGVDGDTSNDLLNRIKSDVSPNCPDLLIIAIGINDSLFLMPDKSIPINLSDFKSNLIKLINEAKNYSKTIVFIGLTNVDESKVQPFPLSSTGKCYSNKIITDYNNVIKTICNDKNIYFVDMLNIISTSDLIDGLHPNSNGYQKMFEVISNYLAENKLLDI